MKKPSPRKPSPSEPDVIIDPALLAREEAPRLIHCVICGSDTQEGSVEQMCWVCRRLKISAWRDVEQQMPAQE